MKSNEPLLSVLELKVLSLLSDDFYSLYEVGWFIHSNCGYPKDESAEIAMNAVKSLLQKNMVALFNQHLGNATLEPLSDAQFETKFQVVEQWISQDTSKEHIVVTATDLGEQYYQKHYKRT